MIPQPPTGSAADRPFGSPRAKAKGAPPQGDSAILVRRTPFGNSSLIVHVVTRTHGRLELIAKGAYRPKSRYAGVLDWFDTLNLEWTQPRKSTMSAASSTLGTLRRGDLDQRRRRITRDLPTYRAAQTAIELIDLATRAGAADASLYQLLEEGLDALDAEPDLAVEEHHAGRSADPTPGGSHGLPSGESEVALHGTPLPGPTITLRLAAFELRLLDSLGLSPSLLACASCGAPAPPVVDAGTPAPRAAFSAHAGGRLCAKHANEAHADGIRVGTLPEEILVAAAGLVRTPLMSVNATGSPREGSRPEPANILDFTGRFLDHHLETRPRSHARFLSAPDRNRRQNRNSTTNGTTTDGLP